MFGNIYDKRVVSPGLCCAPEHLLHLCISVPTICNRQMHEFMASPKQYFIVLEFVEGGSLQGVLEKRGTHLQYIHLPRHYLSVDMSFGLN